MAALESFADYLRKAREKSGQTQAALAARCRLTGSYISLLESGKKPAPSDGVVKRLAAALSLAAEEALQIAHLDRAPEDLRRALDRLRTQAARERDLRERTAEVLFPFSLWNLVPGPLSRRARAAVGPNPDVDIVEAIDHLFDLARRAKDIATLQKETRLLLARLPADRRRRMLDAVPGLVENAAAEGGPRFVTAPEPGLPPEIRPGDTLVVDPALAPAAGNTVLVQEGEGVALRKWEAGVEKVVGVVVEVRRRMR
jgi:transcriptional regulator with XRE-family HTH domain